MVDLGWIRLGKLQAELDRGVMGAISSIVFQKPSPAKRSSRWWKTQAAAILQMKMGEQLVCTKGTSAELKVLLCEAGQPLRRKAGI